MFAFGFSLSLKYLTNLSYVYICTTCLRSLQTPIIMPKNFANFILQRFPPKASSKQMNKITNRKIIQITFVCSKTIDVISISSESDSVPVPCRRWHMFCVSPKSHKVSSGLLSIVLVDCRFIGTILAFWLARETACLARSPLKYCRMAVASVVGQKECVSHTRTHSQSKTAEKEMTGYQNCWLDD